MLKVALKLGKNQVNLQLSSINWGKMLSHLFTKEKRTELRFPVAISSSCFELVSSDAADGKTHDISRGGVCVIASREIPLGTSVEIIFVMSDNNELVERKGIVIWSVRYGDEQHRIGIKLNEPKLKPVPLVLRTIMAHAQAQRRKKSA